MNCYIKGIIFPFIIEIACKRKYNSYMGMMVFKSIDELQSSLGDQLQNLRLAKNLDQRTTAEKAGISERTLRNLEAGRGSSVESLLRVLKALDSLQGIEMLAPKPSINPLALLRSTKVRQRVRHSRKDRHQS